MEIASADEKSALQRRFSLKGPEPSSGRRPHFHRIVIARRYDEAISFEDSLMEIASADEKSASQRRSSLKDPESSSENQI